MNRRLLLFALVLNLVFAPNVAWAQQPRISVVGYLVFAAGPDDPLFGIFRQGLRELGYVEGRNIRFEFRTAQGHSDRLPDLADQLVQLIALPGPDRPVSYRFTL